MEKIILTNAFSLQMINLDLRQGVEITPVDVNFVKRTLFANRFTSAIGHTDTASVLTEMLGVKVNPNRINVKLDFDTTIIVAQLLGGRLPEGATKLPIGYEIKFFAIQLKWTSKNINMVEIETDNKSENSLTCGYFPDYMDNKGFSCDNCPNNMYNNPEVSGYSGCVR